LEKLQLGVACQLAALLKLPLLAPPTHTLSALTVTDVDTAVISIID